MKVKFTKFLTMFFMICLISLFLVGCDLDTASLPDWLKDLIGVIDEPDAGGNQGSEGDNQGGNQDDEGDDLGGNEPPIEDKEKEFAMTSLILPGIETVDDIDKYAAEVDQNGNHYNEQVDNGIIYSPYFTLKVDGKDVEVYATRTSIGAHSFAYVDVNKDEFNLNIDLTVLVGGKTKVVVIPEKHNVTTRFNNNHVTCNITKCGSFSFVFNESIMQPFTLIVRKTNEFSVPEGYKLNVVEPGIHNNRSETNLSDEKSVLYFKKGLHYVHNISVASNSIIYFEDGAYIVALMPKKSEETPTHNPDWAGKTRWRAFLRIHKAEHVQILGRGVLDFSAYEWHARSPVGIEGCYDVDIEGLTLVNATEWNLTCTLSSDIYINGVVIWGYRQNSDGICMLDCNNCLIENCFARSGDDLFEVKASYGANEKIYDGTLAGTKEVGNITYKNCDGWPDKARGMGIIHECTRNISNCYWIDCTIGFASATWMDRLGCLMVLMGNTYAGTNTSVTISNIHFEYIEIYNNAFYPINVSFADKDTKGEIKDIYFKNIKISNANDIRFATFSKEGTFGNIYFDNIYRKGKRVTGFFGSTGLGVSYEGTQKSNVKLNTIKDE